MSRSMAPRAISRKQSQLLSAVFVGSISIGVASSFFGTLGAPFLLIGLLLGILFLNQFKTLFIVFFPLALVNPLIRLGTSGMVVTDARSFHPLEINLTEYFIIAMLLAWLLGGRSREGERAGRFVNAPLVILFVLTITGMFVAKDRAEGIVGGVEKMLEPLVLFMVVTHTKWDRERLKTAASVLLVIGGVIALKSVYEYYVSPQSKMYEEGIPVELAVRLKSYWAATNVVAAFCNLLMPLAFLRAFNAKEGGERFRAFLSFGCLGLGLAVTETRTAWISAALTLLWLSVRFKRGWILVAATAAALAVFGTTHMLERAQSLMDVGADLSFRQRIDVWTDSIGMIAGSPFLGIGFGSFLQTYRRTDIGVHPHNDFISYGVDMGLLAPIVYLVLLLKVLVACRRALRLSHELDDRIMIWGLLCGIGTAFLHSQMETLLNWQMFGLSYWYILGLLAAYAQMVIMEKTSERDGSSQEAELPTFASAAAAAGSTNRPPG